MHLQCRHLKNKSVSQAVIQTGIAGMRRDIRKKEKPNLKGCILFASEGDEGLNRWLAANGANSANNGKHADAAKRVYLREAREWVIRCLAITSATCIERASLIIWRCESPDGLFHYAVKHNGPFVHGKPTMVPTHTRNREHVRTRLHGGRVEGAPHSSEKAQWQTQ